jgi:alkanesulfonate monooxygenase SsuD/methylene tetrahydromethanopterin reductase-like flavin-dependent oxidoreductase (luciferase family)
MHPLLLGIGISTSAAPDAHPVAEAQAAERLGFDFVSASDHPVGTHPSYETPTLLTWIAARTSRITVLSRVLGVPFRRPALVAKSIESLHRLSEGRVILGLGAGYSDDEIRALGGGAHSPGQKVTGLADAVRIIRGAWTQPSFTHAGEMYSVTSLDLEPKPEQPIPIWLGTFGPRALAVTGRLADGWMPSLGHAPPARIAGMRERVNTAAVAAGRDPGAVRCVYNVAVRIDAAARSSQDEIAGSAAAVIDQFQEFRSLGFSGFNFMVSGADAVAQRQAIAEEVLPALRASAGP